MFFRVMMEEDNIFFLIAILHEDALNIKKRTVKNAKNAKEERNNHLVQVYRELV
ncbi:hypothetical protein I8748_04680 [Nostoc sp. CENA67]|uniref:Uncharacterized protein n=1 Tax=Amazonocrinis nigriterrae CENA67 TaxID=2794033 RepID=A0A8J7HKV1_9NOST|nr:hypothetical protein [Amazonocrinis nigriterrae]MBH8561478.1 hypothetical protein [Amazonocrinis nigriterrae CENA67]